MPSITQETTENFVNLSLMSSVTLETTNFFGGNLSLLRGEMDFRHKNAK